MSTVQDELLSVREAARLLRMSQSTIWRWINQGDIPAYRVGHRRVFVKRAELASLIAPARKNEVTDVKEQPPEGQELWRKYEPAKVRTALEKSAGALTGVDARKLLADVHAARRQASGGRPT